MSSVFETANSVSLEVLLSELLQKKVDVKGRKTSCPFHEESIPSFHIYPTNTYYCWSCKRHGNPVSLVQEFCNIDNPLDAAIEICKMFNLLYEDTPPKAENKDYMTYISVYKYVVELFENAYFHQVKSLSDEELGESFFYKRGFAGFISRYGLGYCPKLFRDSSGKFITFRDVLSRKFPDIPVSVLDTYGLYDANGFCPFSGRYTFALYDARGNPVGFSARSIESDAVPKYINTKETAYFKKSSLLYNWHIAKKYSSIYVVEGQADALSYVASGIRNVVAPLGTSYTSEHANMLAGKEVILAFDRDAAGFKAMVSVARKYPRVYKAIKEFPTKDANDALMGGFDIKSFASNIVYLPEALLHNARYLYSLDELSGREALYADMNAISKPYSPIARDYFAISLQRFIKGKRALNK